MRIRKLLWPLALLLICTPLLAAENGFRADHPARYVVKKGDTLWDISTRFLKSPWLWPEIWYVNPKIKNPHLIYPGDVISLVYVNGKPMLTLHRGHPTVKLTPHVREVPLAKAIPTIPLSAIGPFLSKSRIVAPAALDNAPYVLAGADEHVASSQSDPIYVRGLKSGGQGTYDIVTKGRIYTDPDTHEVLGEVARYVGSATMKTAGDPATMIIASSNREVLPGDRLLPLAKESLQSNYYPHPPKHNVQAKIIAVMDGVTQIGQYSVVVINRGEHAGMDQGMVLAVYKAGRKVVDDIGGGGKTVTLPRERAGELIVFRTFDRLSFGLIMRATSAMHVGDYVTNP